MMDNKDEFYIGYSNKIGVKTKKKTRFFVLVSLLLIILVGLSFSYFQRPAANSSFDFDTPTLITGIYHESPYPTLRLTLEENVFKDVVLLGFGKYGPEAYLKNFSQDGCFIETAEPLFIGEEILMDIGLDSKIEENRIKGIVTHVSRLGIGIKYKEIITANRRF